MISNITTAFIVTLLLSADSSRPPEKLVLNFEVNPAADGRPEACVFVGARDFMTQDVVDFQPSKKFLTSACERFLALRRKMLRPGDAASFETHSEQALWLKSDPDAPQPVPYAAM